MKEVLKKEGAERKVDLWWLTKKHQRFRCEVGEVCGAWIQSVSVFEELGYRAVENMREKSYLSEKECCSVVLVTFF